MASSWTLVVLLEVAERNVRDSCLQKGQLVPCCWRWLAVGTPETQLMDTSTCDYDDILLNQVIKGCSLLLPLY